MFRSKLWFYGRSHGLLLMSFTPQITLLMNCRMAQIVGIDDAV